MVIFNKDIFFDPVYVGIDQYHDPGFDPTIRAGMKSFRQQFTLINKRRWIRFNSTQRFQEIRAFSKI